MMDTPIEGERFSLNYLRRGGPLRDCPRARRRIYKLFEALHWDTDDYASLLEEELGVKVPFRGIGFDWDAYFERCELRDLLDSITVLARKFRKHHRDKTWIETIERIFREENLGYRLDRLGGVHFFLDEEFEAHRSATLQGLADSRFVSAKTAFEACHRALDATPPDARGAIRHLFDAVENVFRIVVKDSAHRLGAKEIERHLRPRVDELYAGTAQNSGGRLIVSFKEWVNSAHHYRHAPATEVIEEPPLELATLAIDTGTAFLRWLISLDYQLGQAEK